ncbi:MAG: M23 family metallopeptidase [Vicinamibacterales bacterium]
MIVHRHAGFAAAVAAALAMAGAGVNGAAPGQEPAQPPALVITHSARALEPGEAVLLTFKAAAGPITSARGTAFGQPFTAYSGASPDTWHALVGIDLSHKPGRAMVDVDARLANGSTLAASLPLTVGAKAFATRQLRVAPEFVTPPPAEQARIERERLLLNRILSAISPRPLWGDGFGRPVDGAVISVFGVRSVFNGEARAPHRGVDFRGATGTPVRAPARGVVVLAEALYFSGSAVVLDHGMGVFSLLGHLSRIDVRPGGLVLRGDVVGAVGATGRVTGPHLHWTLRIGPAAVDPLSVLAIAGAER